MRIIILFPLFFLISCNTIKKENKHIVVIDSVNYTISNFVASGLYQGSGYLFNLCVYESDSDIESIRKTKSTFSQKKIANKLMIDSLIPLKLTLSNDSIIRIIYKDLDSIPRVYYEFTDMNSWNKEKTIGQLYLLYENWGGGNEDRRIYISDTTKKYNFFILETAIKHTMYKYPNPKLPQNEGVSITRVGKQKTNLKLISYVNRIILDSEIHKNEKP